MVGGGGGGGGVDNCMTSGTPAFWQLRRLHSMDCKSLSMRRQQSYLGWLRTSCRVYSVPNLQFKKSSCLSFGHVITCSAI